MNLTKWATRAAGLLVLGVLGFGLFKLRAAAKIRDALTTAIHEQEVIRARIAGLEAQVPAEAKRAQAAEADNVLLQRAVQEAQTSQTATVVAAAAPISVDAVNARFRRAKELARNGDPAVALKEFLWCFDVGMRGVGAFGGIRGASLLDEIVKLGQPGLAALQERRAQAQQMLLAGSNGSEAASDFSYLSRKLNDPGLILSVFDQMPSGEARVALSIYGSAQLVEAQRYRDVMIGKSYGSMSSAFELSTQDPANPNRDFTIQSTATNIEVLAGVGDLAHAQTLLNRLLTYDSSEKTKGLIQHHLERAGHPELLVPSPAK
jgi:hypothetical protein